MALTIKNNNFAHPDNRFEHHRNPSGLNNKINYLLVESKRDISKLQKMKEIIVVYNEKSERSWNIAFEKASNIISAAPYTTFVDGYIKEKLLLGLESEFKVNIDNKQRDKATHIITDIEINKDERRVLLHWVRFTDDDSKRKCDITVMTYDEFISYVINSINKRISPESQKIDKNDMIIDSKLNLANAVVNMMNERKYSALEIFEKIIGIKIRYDDLEEKYVVDEL